MEGIRRPFQGVTNVVLFNWHFYVLAVTVTLITLVLGGFWNSYVLILLGVLVLVATSTSLMASFYVYDVSGLYALDWLDEIDVDRSGRLLNMNAGFDETSDLLDAKYPLSSVNAFDFYDPRNQTEVSIERARHAYPSYKSTAKVRTFELPVDDDAVDTILVIFSAHEIRIQHERVDFFRELSRAVKSSGNIIVTEHLRDVWNLLAYSAGVFHFFPRSTWQKTFDDAGLSISREIKITPFVTTFVLNKNGSAP